ncbi:MAG: hypothetical protein EKK55_16245 [Rhodocyclaceae bacterium]|nr:MAG: hypothetical protein EKK55_16245 [Rhodocyclaceae bacterium]
MGDDLSALGELNPQEVAAAVKAVLEVRRVQTQRAARAAIAARLGCRPNSYGCGPERILRIGLPTEDPNRSRLVDAPDDLVELYRLAAGPGALPVLTSSERAATAARHGHT